MGIGGAEDRVSGFTTYVTGDRSLMSRDIGHSRRGVEASGRGFEDRRRPAQPSRRRRSSTGSPGDICTGCWPATGKAAWKRSSHARGDPRSNSAATSVQVRDRIITLRQQLSGQGLDAGPVTIAWHLEREGHRPPSTSTIRRILHTAGLVIPEPRKRPRSSYIRFEAAQPNETWQSDFTHWTLTRRHRHRDPELAR